MYTAREEHGVLRVKGRSRRRHQQSRAGLTGVCDQWQNGSNSEMMLTVELRWSFADDHSRAAEACRYSISHSEECKKQSHIAAQQDLSFVDTIILLGMPWLSLVFLSR